MEVEERASTNLETKLDISLLDAFPFVGEITYVIRRWKNADAERHKFQTVYSFAVGAYHGTWIGYLLLNL